MRDLRISVTDRCNFRCTYCMPREVFGAEYRFLPREEILSFEEIARLAAIFVALGVEKLRLTGGEPLLRRELERLIAMLARRAGRSGSGADHERLAAGGAGRGLARGGLAPAHGERRFARSGDGSRRSPRRRCRSSGSCAGSTRRGAAGFAPIKINMVVKRGVNEDDFVPMARRFGEPGYILRFIEYMDVGNTNGWRLEEVVPAAEIEARLAGEFALDALACRTTRARSRGAFGTRAGGEIGIISSVTAPFCAQCTRARLSADGRLYTCLFATEGFDLRGPLRAGASDEELRSLIGGDLGPADDRYSELRQRGSADEAESGDVAARRVRVGSSWS